MKYTKDARIDIGRRVHEHEITYKEAEEQYGLSSASISNYVQLYRSINGIIPSKGKHYFRQVDGLKMDELKSLSKDELINELIRAKVNEERAKKGYMVKGGGREKEFVSIVDKNMK